MKPAKDYEVASSPQSKAATAGCAEFMTNEFRKAMRRAKVDSVPRSRLDAAADDLEKALAFANEGNIASAWRRYELAMAALGAKT